MITIKEKSLTIEICHPAPEQYLIDLRLAIIQAILEQSSESLSLNSRKVIDANNTLLELLRVIVADSS